ncbi:MAG: excinuclease ABC subunit A [Bdellovibrionaceae bacterium]|nr:excinuclease ABC subunit A [Pseudobdellovibrionaceae bacterium]|tara:strand:- start:3847 stop:6807 length:2961 start_codon:yes stop_codon:yes gene_type:complete
MTKANKDILIYGAEQNNLKKIDVRFPEKKLTVITGLSGSGKSSLAFETLYAEGQRRYIESLSTYTRQFLEKMPKPKVVDVKNIPPAIALEQRNHVVNSRSTVGTQTEIVDYLRVLFGKAGRVYCKECKKWVEQLDASMICQEAIQWIPNRKAAILAPLKPIERIESVTPKKKKKSAKKKKAKKKKVSKKKNPVPSSLNSVLLTLREQGFRRLIWKPTGKRKIQELDLDDYQTEAFPEMPESAYVNQELFLVVDRLKTKEVDRDTEVRLMDSIQQALRIGNETVILMDYDHTTKKEGWQVFNCEFACSKCKKKYTKPTPQLFSFNSPIGACPDCNGFGHTLDLDESKVVPFPNETIKNGAIDPLSKPSTTDWQVDLWRFCERHGISIGKKYSELTQSQKDLIWNGHPDDRKFFGIRGCFKYLETKKYKLHVRVFIRRYQSQKICESCHGARLQPDALAVQIGDKNIAEILDFSVQQALQWLHGVKLSADQKKISKEVLYQIDKRLTFLEAVGVGYLTLSRLAKTLSGGEFQRINLATQLGNGLCGTLYVLDEPSIGLHAADTERLIDVLKDLRDQGNTLVVVEHDPEVMKAADWLVEIGPAAGHRGGELVLQGEPKDFLKAETSLTAPYIGDQPPFVPKKIRNKPQKWIEIKGARENNLRNVNVRMPLERLAVVTGVSGSGKSTLLHQTLYRAIESHFSKNQSAEIGAYDSIYGLEQIRGVVLLDQKPIGKSSRSNPATYMKAWDEVRRIYASQVISLRRGFSPQYFSFNVDGGRCPVCKGEGEVSIDMHFMADVKIPCEECEGDRFKKNVLDVTYRGHNISQLLRLTIDQAYDLFRDNSVLLRKFGLLRDVGLGYLQVGQSATTLSGGESQRLKIASALETHFDSRMLFVFDEPTTGLHQEDVKKFLQVVQDLVESHQTVWMVEHHMDVIAQADWVIDIGPGGGTSGGKVVAQMPPFQLVHHKSSVTGKMMRELGYVFPEVDLRDY